MIDKYKVHDTMQRTSSRRRQSLAWDSQLTRERNDGKYIREKSGAPYNTNRWHRLARAFIESHPLCEECKRKGKIQAAECVDHNEYFFDPGNLQALCYRCNSEKGNRDKEKIQEWKRTHGGEGASNL